MSGIRVYEFHQREIDDLKTAAVFTVACCTNLKRLLEGIRDNQPNWAHWAIKEFLDHDNQRESYLHQVDHLIDPVGVPEMVPTYGKRRRRNDGTYAEVPSLTCSHMREYPLAHRAAWAVHDALRDYLWDVWRRGHPTLVCCNDVSAVTDELVESRWQEIRDELEAMVDYNCDGLRLAVEAESKAAIERCRQSIVGDATTTLKPDIGTGVSLGNVADDEAANAYEKELQNALETHGIRPEVAETLSPEQKRNIIMANWSDTPAKTRNRWQETKWTPSLGMESKTKLADKVKTYIKRGQEKLRELANEE